ncbi:Juvenile hormone-inducible protein [Aphelenchoides fujianensis]|nr:Juvenile hormone-inducible protein [Aphelenchoides fujianensis]
MRSNATSIRSLKATGCPGMPLVYHADAGGDSQPGVIVLEDLSRKCGTLELSGGATIEQCWSVLRLLARLQIHMEYASKKEWKGRFKEQSHCTTFFDSFFNGFLPLVRKEHPDFIPLIEGMAAISTPEFARYALLDRPLGLEAVGFNHGDCWVNNVLFEKNADGSLTNNARFLLDWQMAFEGNPLFDFARFLTIAADAEVRRVVQPTAAERFHEMLTEEKRKATGDPQATVRWRREDLRELFDLAYLQQSTLFLIAPAFTRLAAVEGEAEGVVAARVEKVKLRAKLNCEDVFPLIKKHKLDEKFR